MRSLALVFVMVLVACSPSEGAEETSTAPDGTTTSVGATIPDETTTTGAPPTTADTTTTEATTTTTQATTTTTVASGNWADQPIVVSDFGALGWWDGTHWVQVDEATPLPVTGGEDYQVILIGDLGATSGGAEEVVCEPLMNPGVTLADPGLLGAWPGPYGVAISAPWILAPHLVESLVDDGTYSAFAAELLSERGLIVAEPVIKQLFRIDIEGDGVNEVLVVAEEMTLGFFGEVGDYSIVFLRKVVEGEVQTAVLGESIILDAETDFPAGFTVGAIADLNGDSRMEVVVDSAYYEGLGVEVWEYVNDNLGPVAVIGVGCGA